jgi:hypothetical protein
MTIRAGIIVSKKMQIMEIVERETFGISAAAGNHILTRGWQFPVPYPQVSVGFSRCKKAHGNVAPRECYSPGFHDMAVGTEARSWLSYSLKRSGRHRLLADACSVRQLAVCGGCLVCQLCRLSSQLTWLRSLA